MCVQRWILEYVDSMVTVKHVNIAVRKARILSISAKLVLLLAGYELK